MEKVRAIATMLLAATAFAGTPAMAQQGTDSKGATANTERANAAVRQAMTMNDKQDFEDATRGLMAQLKDPIVKAADGRVVWNTQRYEFVKGDPPATVNPSLWREQKLNTAAGLFKVVDGVYQIRGYDMANMTLVEGASGWIVIDTLFTEDAARAGLKLAMETLKSSKPVVAVIYTHSHADHFGGVRGVVDEADVRSGKIPPAQMPGILSASHQIGWTVFRFGPKYGEVFPDQQFPMEAIDEFYKQMIPDLNSTLAQNPNPTWTQMAALGVKLDGAVLMGHSESGFFPEQAALIDPKGIKGIVSIEMPCVTDFGAAQLATLAKIPTLLMFGDHLGDVAGGPANWQQSFETCKTFADQVNKAGGSATMMHLPALGIKGNSHMLMQDKNSDQLADLVIKWIDEHVEKRK